MDRFALIVERADGTAYSIADLLAFREDTIATLKRSFRDNGERVLAVIRRRRPEFPYYDAFDAH